MTELPEISPIRRPIGNTRRFLEKRAASNPARLIVEAWLVYILAGALLLMLPISSESGQWTPFVDAFFTSTSAVCVTGLTVVDTASHFSLFGKIVLLFLIETGGLGIMTAAAFVAMVLGKRFQVRDSTLVRESIGEVADMRNLGAVLKAIAAVALMVQIFSVLLLFGQFMAMDYGATQSFWYALFHSVSAFNNAGFALFPDSFASFAHYPGILLTVSAASFCGSIGFIVFLEFWNNRRRRRRDNLPRIYSLQTKLAVTTSLALVAAGTAFFWAFEVPRGLMDGLAPHEQLAASLFTSVTTRTTGFNVLDTGALSTATLFMLMVLMFIGGSPLSTAGGIKTTTFAVLHLAFRSIVLRDHMVHAYERRISAGTVRRALAISFTAVGLLVLGSLLMLWLEGGKPYLSVFFEVVSAMNTVGLSMGVTASLSSASKFVVAALMIAGRLGPLTVVLSVAGSQPKGAVLYPKDTIMVG